MKKFKTDIRFEKIRNLSLLKRTSIVFILFIIMVMIIFPFYENKNKKNDEVLLEKIKGYEVLIETRLIALIMNTKESLDNNYLNELEEVAIKLDENYRLISSFNKEQRDFYGYFSATINTYIDKLKEFEETNNPEFINEANEVLNEFYDYKRSRLINNNDTKDSLSNLIENNKIQIKNDDESEVDEINE